MKIKAIVLCYGIYGMLMMWDNVHNSMFTNSADFANPLCTSELSIITHEFLDELLEDLAHAMD